MKRFDPKPVLNTERFEACFKAIDAHTEGEFCRVVYAGFPEGVGDTILERKYYLQKNGKMKQNKGNGKRTRKCSRTLASY